MAPCSQFLFLLLPIVLLIQLAPKLRFFFCGFPTQNPTEVFWAGADKLGVLLYSRQADRQVEAQLKTLGSRHVRYKTVQTVSAIWSSAHNNQLSRNMEIIMKLRSLCCIQDGFVLKVLHRPTALCKTKLLWLHYVSCSILDLWTLTSHSSLTNALHCDWLYRGMRIRIFPHSS